MLTRDSAFFKLFLNDVGLLASCYMDGIQLGETDINFGAVYENFVAQELHAHGFPLYYFNSRKVGEVDFLVEHDGRIMPIEVKSGNHYKSHPALNALLRKTDYGFKGASVFCNANTAKDGVVDYLPIYFTMFMQRNPLPPNMNYDLPI